MKKRLLAAALCVCIGLFCTLGCEKKSDTGKAVDDAAKKLDKAAGDAVDKAADHPDHPDN